MIWSPKASKTNAKEQLKITSFPSWRSPTPTDPDLVLQKATTNWRRCKVTGHETDEYANKSKMRYRGLRSRCESRTKWLQSECGRWGVFCEKELWELHWDIRANLNVKGEIQKRPHVRSAEIASKLSKEQKQLMRKLLISLFPLRSGPAELQTRAPHLYGFLRIGQPFLDVFQKDSSQSSLVMLVQEPEQSLFVFQVVLGFESILPIHNFYFRIVN